jgi:hypothetical protein
MDMDVSVCAYGHFLYGPWTYLSLSLSLSFCWNLFFAFSHECLKRFFPCICVCVCVVLSPEEYKPQETDEIGWRFSYSNGPPFQSSVVCSATWGRRLTQSHWQTRDHADQIISHWPCCVFYTENVAAALCVHCDIHGVGVHYLSRAATNR